MLNIFFFSEITIFHKFTEVGDLLPSLFFEGFQGNN